jgi:4-amino-4-deoxychorismate lyase
MSETLQQVLVNGVASNTVAVTDRGLLYGDGVFETLAVIDAAPRLWTRHIARLQDGCARLGIAPLDAVLLAEEAQRVCHDAGRAVLKIIITRGSGGRGYRPNVSGKPTRILQCCPWPDYPRSCETDGVAVRLCRLRMGHNPSLAGIKHLNRLEQVLARGEWDDPAVREGLVLDQHGNLIEGTMSNVCLVQGGRLLMPDLARCGVAGVIRALLLELAEVRGIATAVRDIGVDELAAADEVFLCNSLIGIWPVTRIDDRVYPAGKLTRQLQELLRNYLENEQ